MKGKQQQDFRVEKYIRYGIRKYSFGAASVAIAAGLMFLGNGAVSASEASVNGNTADSSVVASNPENDGTSTKEETSVTEKEVKAEEPKKVDTSVQKEAEQKTPTEAPKANTEKAAANKTALYEAISNLENRIAAAKNADASALSAAKEALATAKSVFANPTDGQSDNQKLIAKQKHLRLQRQFLQNQTLLKLQRKKKRLIKIKTILQWIPRF